jgi:hypothetical protein
MTSVYLRTAKALPIIHQTVCSSPCENDSPYLLKQLSGLRSLYSKPSFLLWHNNVQYNSRYHTCRHCIHATKSSVVIVPCWVVCDRSPQYWIEPRSASNLTLARRLPTDPGCSFNRLDMRQNHTCNRHARITNEATKLWKKSASWGKGKGVVVFLVNETMSDK